LPRDTGAAAVRIALRRFSGPSALIAVAGRWEPTRTTGRSCFTVRLRKYAVSSSVLVPCVITTPETAASVAKIALMRLAIVSQFSSVTFGLPTFTTCSTLTLAYCLISGTAATSCSPRIEPALYSDSAVVAAPFPAIVPPVDSTTTVGNVAPCACAYPDDI
jgi:hypothetical protein